jgi:hypothetical protein
MQPTPSLAHNPAICNCNNRSDVVNSPFYLWVHLPSGQDQVISFKSLKDAYKAAEDYVFMDAATQAPKGIDPYDYYGALWTAKTGAKWCVPDLDWVTTMCSIVDDIHNKVEPAKGGWLAVATGSHQMIVGQGTDLPLDAEVARLINPRGYKHVSDAADYSKSTDVSAATFRGRVELASVAQFLAAPAAPAAAPAEPEPLSLQHTGRHWLTEDVGERSPHLITPQQAQPYLLGSLQSYLRTMLGLSTATVAPISPSPPVADTWITGEDDERVGWQERRLKWQQWQQSQEQEQKQPKANLESVD